MRILKSQKDLNAFVELCKKYQPYDPRYADLTMNDDCFIESLVESAYLIYLILVLSSEDSSVKKAYNSWRTYYHGDSRRIYILFNYVDHLMDQSITDIWHKQFDAKRNIDKSWELISRIYITWGIVGQKAFKHIGASND